MAHRSFQTVTGAKSRRIESQGVKIQLPESHNQTDLQFTEFTTQATQRSHSIATLGSDEKCPFEKPLGQFVIRRGQEINTVIQNRKEKPKRVCRIQFIPSQNLQWSPLGTYLLGIGDDILRLFAGDAPSSFIFHFEHPMVEEAHFSPGEKYLVTYTSNPQLSDPESFWLKFFNVTTGRIVLGLENHATDAPVMIRWSGGGDDKYFATLHKNTASVYVTPNFSLLGQKHNDVQDLSWSPTDSILVLLKGEPTTKVVLVQIPSEKVLMDKDVSSSDCKMYWQSNGKYLAVIVDQQHMSSLFELFYISGSSITSVELKVEKFLAFSWEPNGHRFAVIHRDGDVSFYAMENGKASIQSTYQNKQVDTLSWSPRGKQIVLAALKGSPGSACLELLDVENVILKTTMEHPYANNIAWDPTGRYVATSVTISEENNKWGKRKIDGFKMWSASTGQLLYLWRTPDYRLLQLSWRPYEGTIEDEMLQNEESEDEFDYWPSDLPNPDDEDYSIAEGDEESESSSSEGDEESGSSSSEGGDEESGKPWFKWVLPWV